MRSNEKIMDCKKCNSGKVKVIYKEHKDDISIRVNKCSNPKCKYQYHIKELFKANNLDLRITE